MTIYEFLKLLIFSNNISPTLPIRSKTKSTRRKVSSPPNSEAAAPLSPKSQTISRAKSLATVELSG